MAEAAKVASALTEVRDVIEAYRRFELIVPDWSSRLTAAVAALQELAPTDLRGDATELAAKVKLLITAGLPTNPSSVESVAHSTSYLLDKFNQLGVLRSESRSLEFPTLTM